MNKFVPMIFLLLPVVAVLAQSGFPVPLILKPADRMQWKLTPRIAKSADMPEAPSNSPTSISITKDGSLSRVVLTTGDEKAVELWRVENNTLYPVGHGPRVTVIRDNPNTSPYPYASAGFFGIENVKPADEQPEATVFSGAKCRHFCGSLATGEEYEAWFEAATGLPKGYRTGTTMLIYEFGPLPGTLSLPPEFETAWRINEANLRRAGLL